MRKNFTLTFLFLSLSLCFFAQNTNVGEFYVSENTVLTFVDDFDNQSTGEFWNNGDVYSFANWNNDGIVDYDALSTGGLTRFIGTQPQIISGSNFNYLYDVLFDNTSNQPAFYLSGSISVGNQSDFSYGIVDNDNFGGSFVFENNANHTLTSDDSHVDGTVTKIGDDSFEFPIGDSEYYRYAIISNPNSLIFDVFSAKYFLEDTNTNYPTANKATLLTHIDQAEHWIVTRSDSSISEDVLLTLSWSEFTTPNELLAAPLGALTIARWDPILGLWVNQGGAVDEVSQTITSVIDGYGVFTLARISDDNIMPCNLELQNVITPNDDAINDFFEIKRTADNRGCVNNVNVKVFNRWGVEVYSNSNYSIEGDLSNVFNAISKGHQGLSSDGDSKLPTGTYYYALEINHNDNDAGTPELYKKVDYLYINGEGNTSN